MFNMNNMGAMMKQAQQLQDRLQKAQEEVKALEVTGESGAGLVRITMNGAHEVRRVELDPGLMQEDKEVCEDLLAAAFNDACRRVEDASAARMSDLAAGLKLPPGFKLPF